MFYFISISNPKMDFLGITFLLFTLKSSDGKGLFRYRPIKISRLLNSKIIFSFFYRIFMQVKFHLFLKTRFSIFFFFFINLCTYLAKNRFITNICGFLHIYSCFFILKNNYSFWLINISGFHPKQENMQFRLAQSMNV